MENLSEISGYAASTLVLFTFVAKGMGRWDDVLTRADAEAVHAYIVEQAWRAYDQHRVAARPGSR